MFVPYAKVIRVFENQVHVIRLYNHKHVWQARFLIWYQKL